MQIRFTGSKDLITRIAKLTGQQSSYYHNRSGSDIRYYINLDDRTVESWLSFLEDTEGPIQFEVKDFRV